MPDISMSYAELDAPIGRSNIVSLGTRLLHRPLHIFRSRTVSLHYEGGRGVPSLFTLLPGPEETQYQD